MNHIHFAQPYFLREVMGVGSVMAGQEEEEESQFSTPPNNQALYSGQLANPGDASQATASDFYSQSSARTSSGYGGGHITPVDGDQNLTNQQEGGYDPVKTDPTTLEDLVNWVNFWVEMMRVRGGAANQISGLMGYMGMTWQMWYDVFYDMFFGGGDAPADGGGGFGHGNSQGGHG